MICARALLALALLGCASGPRSAPTATPHPCVLPELSLEPLDLRAVRYSVPLAAVNHEFAGQADSACPERYACVPVYVFLGVLQNLNAYMKWAKDAYGRCPQP